MKIEDLVVGDVLEYTPEFFNQMAHTFRQGWREGPFKIARIVDCEHYLDIYFLDKDCGFAINYDGTYYSYVRCPDQVFDIIEMADDE